MTVTWKRLTALSIAFGLVLGNASGALAHEPRQESDAHESIEAVIPGILSETAGSERLDLTEAGAISVGALLNAEGISAEGVNFSIDYVDRGADPISPGLTEYSGSDDSVGALVQETAAGVRVMTVVSDPSAPSSYSYTFDVPDGTEFVETEAGFSLQSGEQLFGNIQKPWAYDASGQSVPTWFEWKGGVLTQHLDLASKSLKYPVVADPAWTYTYKFAVTKTAASNKALLKKCFNCYFPVQGAPKSFPKPGQLLPLRVVSFLNFECKFKRETTSGSNYFAFQFDATKNHVDKLGSNIIFQFRTISGKKYLTIDPYIVNDAIWVKNEAYRVGAWDSWNTFAKNLNRA